MVSILGSVVGSERLVYNPWTYAIFHRAALEISPTMVEGIMTLFPTIKSASDFGCGTGAYVAEFRKLKVLAEGFEYSPIARRLARDAFNLEIAPFDLNHFAGAGATFDLSTSFEVAEHLPLRWATGWSKSAVSMLHSSSSPPPDTANADKGTSIYSPRPIGSSGLRGTAFHSANPGQGSWNGICGPT